MIGIKTYLIMTMIFAPICAYNELRSIINWRNMEEHDYRMTGYFLVASVFLWVPYSVRSMIRRIKRGFSWNKTDNLVSFIPLLCVIYLLLRTII